jgi:hypothetical protein
MLPWERRAGVRSFFEPTPEEERLALASPSWWTVAADKRERERKRQRPTLASVSKAAVKAALAVARYELRPDGTIVVVTGTPEPSPESNPWLDDPKVTKR